MCFAVRRVMKLKDQDVFVFHQTVFRTQDDAFFLMVPPGKALWPMLRHIIFLYLFLSAFMESIYKTDCIHRSTGFN